MYEMMLIMNECGYFAEVLPRQRILMYRCPEKYFRVGNNCYHLSTDKLTWREAIFSCEDLKGRLAVLNSKLEDQKLRKYLNRHKPGEFSSTFSSILPTPFAPNQIDSIQIHPFHPNIIISAICPDRHFI